MKRSKAIEEAPAAARANELVRRVAMQEIITFKADPSLVEAMKGIANRSDFIRAAVLAALDSSCPLCRGTGILTPNQKQHWDSFATNHTVRECADCAEPYLTCSKTSFQTPHGHH